MNPSRYTLLPSLKLVRLFSMLLLGVLFSGSLQAQISFLSDEIVTNLSSPTSLQIGPDGRLYVTQQNGTINIYTINRNGPGDFSVTDTETLTDVKNILNRNDDGSQNPGQGDRQVTGIMVTGSGSNPVMYISHSDPRIAVGSDSNLDTNSGTLTRLTWVGTNLSDPAGYWDMVHLVRGLPRSEENHANNGMSLDSTNNILYITVGGATNKGAPSNNFAATPEYALGACILSFDMSVIEAMPTYTDLRTGEKFKYDIPTIDDPTVTNIDNTDPNFPYEPGHPQYNESIDPGDPFGGNDGLNQARWIQGGPVQVYAGGFRNPYDVVYTTQNRVYTIDNGPNGGWGGVPKTYNSAGVEITNGNYDPANGDYVTNEFSETNSYTFGDGLHYVTPGYQGSHPVPTRANPLGSNLYVYEKVGGVWTPTSASPYDWATDFPDPPVPQALARPEEGKSVDVAVSSLAYVTASTNGLCEYRATNFSGAMQGDLLAVSFNGNVIRFELNAAGDAVTNQSNLLTGNGSQPLDIWAQGDFEEFPGTIWVCFHGANKVMVFEPNDFAPFNCTGADDIALDEDGDGFTNADEIDNGTDPCNQGNKPDDYDGDFISNLNDPDDDNDGLLDTEDPFAVDPNNGLSTNLPINYSFSIDNDNSVQGSMFGLGFTGMMTDDTDLSGPNSGTDYQTWYNTLDLNLGGATGKLGIENVTDGTAEGSSNDQDNGFQLGLNVDVNSPLFTAETSIESPFFLVNGNPLANPIDDQSMGMYIGQGNMDNFVKVEMHANGGAGGLRVYSEIAGSGSEAFYNVPGILNVTSVRLYLEVTPDPTTPTVQPAYSTDGGATVTPLGSPVNIPVSWLDAGDAVGLAVGVISTSTNSATPFDATWDYLNVRSGAPNVYAPINDILTNYGTPDQVINLNDHFEDDNGTVNLTYSVTGNSGSEVTTSINTNILTVGIPASTTDTAQLIVRATDTDGYFAEDTFMVWVISPAVVLYRVDCGNWGQNALDAPNPDWDLDKNSNPSPYRNTGSLENGATLSSTDASVPSYVPSQIFQRYRWDPSGDDELEWTFPAGKSGVYEVNLFFIEGFFTSGGQRVFDVEVEGSLFLEDFDIYLEKGTGVGFMKTMTVIVTDGELNINFHHVLEHPVISAIEILGPAQINLEGQLNMTPNPIHFFSTEVGTTSSAANLTLENTGVDALEVTSLDLTGDHPGDFAVTATLPITIVPGGSATVPVTFSPTAVGSRSANLEATHSGTNGTQQILVTGEAIPNGASTNVFGRVNAGGPTASPATAYGIDWGEDQASSGANAGGNANSGTPNTALTAGGEHTFGTSSTINIDGSIEPAAGEQVFQTMRYDVAGGDDMTYEFSVTPGTIVQIRLFFAETELSADGARVFDVEVEGSVPSIFDDLDIHALAGQNKAVMRSYTTTVNDNTLSLVFQAIAGNPMISAIELNDIGSANAFPVTWLGLDAEMGKDGVMVSWLTASELNNDYFEVERSIDGGNFEVLGFVKSKGNSNTPQSYDFLDMQYSGTNLSYRIKQIDFDGNFTYSPEVELSIAQDQLFVFPNPASESVTIMLPQVDESMNLQILDMSGKIWYREHIEYAPQDGKQISVSELPDGVYVVMLNFRDGRKQSLRLVKQVR